MKIVRTAQVAAVVETKSIKDRKDGRVMKEIVQKRRQGVAEGETVIVQELGCE